MKFTTAFALTMAGICLFMAVMTSTLYAIAYLVELAGLSANDVGFLLPAGMVSVSFAAAVCVDVGAKLGFMDWVK